MNAIEKAGRRAGYLTRYFLGLNISKKLMLGFSSLLALLVLISVFALINLNRINAINSDILQIDLPIITASEKMIDVVLAQELYARRYLILGSSDVLNIFLQKEKEFERLMDQMRAIPADRNYPVDKIAALHQQYKDILFTGTKRTNDAKSSAAKNFEKRIKIHQEKLIAEIKGMASEASQDQHHKTAMTAQIGRVAFKASAVLCALGFLLSLTAAMIITHTISGAIKKLKHATEMIAKGQFDYKPDIQNHDELGELAGAFELMAKRLKRLEEMSLDTSPLTRLPGGISIESEMNKRISTHRPIAFCLMDIDNFKAYNDRYGYAKGNKLIKGTAEIIAKAVSMHGNNDDFIGHIGGDDFVVITSPDNFKSICTAITKTYDKSIPIFYDEADKRRGYIIGENRQGDQVKFPLASISIAVVTNERRNLLNHIQYGEVAAELKEHAKSKSGSIFLVDQRRDDPGNKNDRKLIKLQDHKKVVKG
jgi:GGDEF domain-containing protein/CHASE3 domain sensor protein